jgi:hypothetical protein
LQVIATAMMHAAMRTKSFVVARTPILRDYTILQCLNYKASEKISETKFFVAAISRGVKILPNMHFSTSNISGKGKKFPALRRNDPSR